MVILILYLSGLIISICTDGRVRLLCFWEAFNAFEAFKAFEVIELLEPSATFYFLVAGTFCYLILVVCRLTTDFCFAIWFCLTISILLIVGIVEADREVGASKTIGLLLKINIGSEKMFLKVFIYLFLIASLLILLI